MWTISYLLIAFLVHSSTSYKCQVCLDEGCDQESIPVLDCASQPTSLPVSAGDVQNAACLHLEYKDDAKVRKLHLCTSYDCEHMKNLFDVSACEVVTGVQKRAAVDPSSTTDSSSTITGSTTTPSPTSTDTSSSSINFISATVLFVTLLCRLV